MDGAEGTPKDDAQRRVPLPPWRAVRTRWAAAIVGLALIVAAGATMARFSARPAPPPPAARLPIVTPVGMPADAGEGSGTSSEAGSQPAQQYEVQAGDTLSGIAAMFDTTVDNLQTMNGLDDVDTLQIGQVLSVPASSDATATPASQDAETSDGTPSAVQGSEGDSSSTYTVEDGDTISSIAEQFGVDPDAIIAANDLADPDLLAVGDVLRIPPSD